MEVSSVVCWLGACTRRQANISMRLAWGHEAVAAVPTETCLRLPEARAQATQVAPPGAAEPAGLHVCPAALAAQKAAEGAACPSGPAAAAAAAAGSESLPASEPAAAGAAAKPELAGTYGTAAVATTAAAAAAGFADFARVTAVVQVGADLG